MCPEGSWHRMLVQILKRNCESAGLHINSLSPGVCGYDLESVICNCVVEITFMSISSARWAAQDAIDDKATLVQPMTWCRQATSQYLNQCWLMIKVHAELWCFLWCDPEQIVEQTIEMPVIWDTMTLTLRHTNYTSTVYWCMASNLKASRNYFFMKNIHLCVGLSVCNKCTLFEYRRGLIIVQFYRIC